MVYKPATEQTTITTTGVPMVQATLNDAYDLLTELACKPAYGRLMLGYEALHRLDYTSDPKKTISQGIVQTS